jgi:hypothetical protein
MRKFEMIVGGVALAVLSVSAAYYLANHPVHRGKISVGASEGPRSVSPMDVLAKTDATPMAGTATQDREATAARYRERMRREPVVYPDWKPGEAHIAPDARAVTAPGDFIAPAWSPVGLDIAFTRRDRAGIYVAGTAGGGARALSDDAGIGSAFAWNMDGMSLHLREADGQYAELMITGEQYPAAPKPAKLVERDNIIFYQPEDGDAVPISGAHDRFHGSRLSPDETRVVFLGRETGIYIVNTDGTSLISVGPGQNPSWHPDSSGIVYDIPVSDGTNTVGGDLWYASTDGTERTNLTNSPGIVESHPAVSPDGKRIAFIRDGAVWVGKLQAVGGGQ